MNKLALVFTAALLLVSCNSPRSTVESGRGVTTVASGLPSLSFTVYSGKTELFLECRTFVAGDTNKIAAHFTHTGELFTAITDGTIKLSLITDVNTVSQDANVSTSPGIFRYGIVPLKAGTARIVFDIQTKDYSDQIVIDNIIVYSDVKAAMSAPVEAAKNNEITYLKEQAWKVEFANLAASLQPFNEIIKTTGEILPSQGDEMVVTANAAGIVTFTGNKAVVGTSVNSGDMIFVISGGNLTDGNTETRFKQAKAAYEKARGDYERLLELVRDNIVSQKDFQEAKARYESEQANYNNLARNYQSGGQKVVSPISGYLKNVLVTEGQYVSVGQPLASVSQNRRLVLKAEVSQKYFSKLAAISSANFKTAYDNKTFSLESLNGRLISFGKSNDANTLFIPVTFSFDNQVDIIPGSLVDVFLKLKSVDKAYVIPVSALIEEQGVFFVFVQTAGESFVKRELKLGGSDGINVQVLAGLREGERVVTKGAYQIKLATASGTIPSHGHAH